MKSFSQLVTVLWSSTSAARILQPLQLARIAA